MQERENLPADELGEERTGLKAVGDAGGDAGDAEDAVQVEGEGGKGEAELALLDGDGGGGNGDGQGQGGEGEDGGELHFDGWWLGVENSGCLFESGREW